MTITVPQSRLGTYLTLGLGAGVLGTAGSNAANVFTEVTLYGPGSKSPSSTLPTPAGINIGTTSFIGGTYGYLDIGNSPGATFNLSGGYFTRGTDMTVGGSGAVGYYSYRSSARNGALLNSNQNFANISFNGADNVYEAVGQFFLNGTGGGYLVAIAKSSDNSALSISSGKTAITAVPEPSSIALLALGAAGVLARRRRAA